jgi:DNA-binding HxlR family transcriptional regulator
LNWNAVPKASRWLLDTQLKQLSDQGIISKTIFGQGPPKVSALILSIGAEMTLYQLDLEKQPVI